MLQGRGAQYFSGLGSLNEVKAVERGGKEPNQEMMMKAVSVSVD